MKPLLQHGQSSAALPFAGCVVSLPDLLSGLRRYRKCKRGSENYDRKATAMHRGFYGYVYVHSFLMRLSCRPVIVMQVSRANPDQYLTVYFLPSRQAAKPLLNFFTCSSLAAAVFSAVSLASA